MKVMLAGFGRAGKEVAKNLLKYSDIDILGGICRKDSINRGRDLGEVAGVINCSKSIMDIDDAEGFIKRKKPDVIIDFSAPVFSLKLAAFCKKHRISLVVGTTGFKDDEIKTLKMIAESGGCGIVYAPNITVGVNVMIEVSKLISRTLNNYDFRITEIHHKYKKDAPSGTAKKILSEMEKSREAAGFDAENYPIVSIRAGGYIGYHEVLAAGENDKLVISHESFSRAAFAEGAYIAAKYVKGKYGWFEMADVLGFNNEKEPGKVKIEA